MISGFKDITRRNKTRSGDHLNMKMPSYQYSYLYHKNKTLSWPSYHWYYYPYSMTNCLYIEIGLRRGRQQPITRYLTGQFLCDTGNEVTCKGKQGGSTYTDRKQSFRKILRSCYVFSYENFVNTKHYAPELKLRYIHNWRYDIMLLCQSEVYHYKLYCYQHDNAVHQGWGLLKLRSLISP